MSKSTLSEEEIFFGIVENDGTRSSLIRQQPTLQELEVLWETHPDLFSGTCECGHKNYIYGHTITVCDGNPRQVATSYVSYYCPSCGQRCTKGANYFRAQERIVVLNELAELTI